MLSLFFIFKILWETATVPPGAAPLSQSLSFHWQSRLSVHIVPRWTSQGSSSLK